MGFLKLLEGMRTPFLDELFSIITHLGEETVFILVGIIFFWCIDKRKGYYILSVGFAGTVINQFLKLLFRIPRPWVKDKDFTIVESARAEATGYSFPSGHTQSATGIFGSIARFSRLPIRIICIVLILLTAFSRMYLGVHTPLDVGVSLCIGAFLVFVLYPLVGKACENSRNMRIFLGVLTAVAAAFLAFVLIYDFPADTNTDNLTSGIKNAYKILGCISGLWLAYEIDEQFIKFDTHGTLISQFLKVILGLIPILLIKSLLKEPLYSLFGGSYIADGVRYFLITVFAGGVWPFTFKKFSKIGKK